MDIGKGWDGQKAQWLGRLNRSDGKITVGVCAREKKARSKHMEAITSRLNREKFEVIVFGDACIMDAPVEDWPVCDCLVAFYSTGFPSDKAEAYVKLRRPYALNNLEMQDVLHDRRRVYDLLKSQGVPHPENVYASRDGYGGQVLEALEIVEADDYIQVNNVTIHKPFVEKPVDAENHNVYIYYPMSAGGGSKRLFRKIGDRSSEFYPNVNEIRREGSFVYESFVETQGTDVKVYTVGPDYGHAEARKSPTLDGKVNRNAEGKEIRYPVILTSEEKEYARKITLAFRQCVCGFDILRVQGRSFVCDVNGWSFVKNSRKYVDDCAMLLQEFIEAAVKPGRRMKVFSTERPLIKYQAINIAHHQQQLQHHHHHHHQPNPGGGAKYGDRPPRINTSVSNGGGGSHRLAYLPLSPDSSIDSTSTPGSREVGAGAFAPIGSPASTPPRSPPGEGRPLKHQRKHPEELRAVIAITRHGDRTPKQKMKMKISFPEFLAFYNKYSPGPRKEIKVKGKLHLKEFLGITVELIKTLRVAPSSSAASSPNGEGQQPKQKKTKKADSHSKAIPTENAATRAAGEKPSSAATPTPTPETTPTEAEAGAAAAPASSEPSSAATPTATAIAPVEAGAGATAAAAPIPPVPTADTGAGASTSAGSPPEGREPAESAAMETEPPEPPEPAFTEVDYETYGKLHQIKHVLERWEISGINRKLQLKPRKWEEVDASSLPPRPPAQAKHKDKKAKHDPGGGKTTASASSSSARAATATAGSIHKDTLSKGAMAMAHKDVLRKGVAPPGGGEEGEEEGEGNGKVQRATQLLLILKWGGELTNLGQRQAIELGNSFRTIMYPDSGTGGLLRLHSTFRHDLKIKTSDEGRVMKTAAAFAKGFLELEGDLTPILVSLVSKESSKNSSVMMLDPSGNKDITQDMDRSKDFLQRVMAKDVTFSPELIKSVVPTGQASVRRALRSVGNPVAKLTHLRQLVMVLVKQLSRRSATFPLGTTDRVSAADRELDRGIEADEFATSRVERAEAREKERKQQQQQDDDDDDACQHQPTSRDNRLPARGETPLLMLDRWRNLHDELYDSVNGFDITKIPDVHDNVRYDCLHNGHLELEGLPELYDLAKQLADAIVPQEYGITKGGKLMIGSKMCHALLDKIKYDLLIAMADSEVDMRYQLDLSHVEDLPINSLGRRVRTRLYFTSESHLHTLLNVLRFPIGGHEAVVTEEAKRMLSRTKELCYLTSFVIRLFEDAEKGPEDPARFRVEILFSPGVVKHPMLEGDHLHTAPLVPLHKHLTCKQVVGTLNAAIALSAHETVPDDHSEAEAILHKLDKVVRQDVDRKGSAGSSSGVGGGNGGSGVSPTAATPGNSNGGSGGAAAAAAAEATAGTLNPPGSGDRETQGVGAGGGGPTKHSRDDQQQQEQQQVQHGMQEAEEEDLAGDRQCWYYGGGGWGRSKSEGDGKGRLKEKEKDEEREKKPRSWLSSVTRSASSEAKPPTPQKKHPPRLSPGENLKDGGGGGRSTGTNNHAGGRASDNDARHPPIRRSSMDGREPDEEEGHQQHQQAEGRGYASEPGFDGEEGPEEDTAGSQEDEGGHGDDEGCTDEEEEERTDDGGQGDNDDDDVDDEDDDIDEYDDEGFESDVGRDAQARLASDSFLSLRCESDFFNMDSFSSNTPDEDEGEEEEDDDDGQEEEGGVGQEEQGEQRRSSLGGRPRSREYWRGASNGGGGGSSSKRGLARRAVGAESSAESGGHVLSGAAVAALGVLGAAAAVAAVAARVRRA